MRLLSAAVLLLAIGRLGGAGAAPMHLSKFRNGASSTGWINFEFRDGKEIFIPAKINGYETEVLLANGLPTPDIDKGFAASIGLLHTAGSGTPQENDHDTDSVIHGLQIQIGNLTLPETDASEVDFAALSRHLGHPVPLLLGDDAFDSLVVDIDFALCDNTQFCCGFRRLVPASLRSERQGEGQEVLLAKAHLPPRTERAGECLTTCRPVLRLRLTTRNFPEGTGMT
jgi:hypothetical protein